MRSVCVQCGTTRSKSCRYAKPIRLLWAWLLFDCGGDRQLHVDFMPDYTQRYACRLEFYNLDDVEDWFIAEHGEYLPTSQPLDV